MLTEPYMRCSSVGDSWRKKRERAARKYARFWAQYEREQSDAD